MPTAPHRGQNLATKLKSLADFQAAGGLSGWTLHSLDLGPYLLVLASVLIANTALANSGSRRLRWSTGALAHRFPARPPRPGLQGMLPLEAGDALFLSGGRNVLRLADTVFEPDVDSVRLALTAREVPCRTWYYEPDSVAPSLSRNGSHSITAAKALIARNARRNAVAQDFRRNFHGFREFSRLIGALCGLSERTVAWWLERQADLLLSAVDGLTAAFQARRPRAVFLHGGQNFMLAGAAVAARRLGIPSYEIQHGAISLLDPTRLELARPECFSARLLTWTRHTSQAEELVTGAPTRVFHRWLTDGQVDERLTLPPQAVAAYAQARACVAERLAATGKPGVLIARQHDTSLQTVNGPALSTYAAADLWWRAHPKDLPPSADSPSGFNADRLPLGALLEGASWHVTSYSAVSLDAAAWGKPTVFLDPAGAGFYPGCGGSKAELSDFPKATSRTLQDPCSLPGRSDLISALA